ncbi:GNAT family N-acetyltransferase [Acinetobacter sp.]|uniref:GNAT family N-acetyltransferase n=1 Tax=Acinetobacter sp. TaxID=472 RepID=UPI002FD92591
MYSIQQVKWMVLRKSQQDQLKLLLLEAYPSWEQISTYLSQANIFILLDHQDNIIAQLCLLQNNDRAEIKNLAVDHKHQKQGFAKVLIQQVIENAKHHKIKNLWVKTGNSSLDQLALYQKCGFRMSHIERDAFKGYPKPIYENGIRCLDQVVLYIVFG